MTPNDFHDAPTVAPDPERTAVQAAPAPPPAPRHEDFGPYRILQALGEGGFGIVYLAEQTQPVWRQVAVKVIKPGMDTRAVLSRFEAERQALALMDHPGIAKVLDAGSTPAGRPYFAMELVRGVPLTDYCDRARLSTQERLALFVEVCYAIQHAHQKGIIHRDLKPSNILVTDHDGRAVPKIIDFGISKAIHARIIDSSYHTQQGQFIGTPEYTSPEQADSAGVDVDTRSDIYSLGVVLYELLTGVLPIDSAAIRGSGLGSMSKVLRDAEPPKPSTRLAGLPATPADTPGSPATRTPDDIAKRRRTDPRSLSRQLRGDLDWITMKAMDKDRTRRYESAGALAADILHHLKSEPVTAGPPSTTYRVGKFIRRNRGPVVVAAALLALLAGGASAITVLYGKSEAQRRRAEIALHAEEAARHQAQDALAAEALQRERAQTENRKANAAIEFLNGMLTSIDPNKAKGREITVRDVLDTAATNVETELPGQPEVQSYIREMLGESYYALSNYEGAARQMELALQSRLAVKPADDPEVLALQSKLGSIMISMGRIDEAEKSLRAAYEGRLKLYGPNHQETLAALSLLAMIQQDRGDLEGAEKLIREVIQGQAAATGPGSRATLESRTSLADILKVQGQIAESEKESAEIAEVSAKSLGPDDPMTLQALSLRGSSLYDLGRYDEAERVLRDCVERKNRVFGEAHSSTLITLNILGMTLRKLDRFEEAEQVARRVVEQAKVTLGPEHSATLSYMNNLAQAIQARGELEEAEEMYRAVLDLRRRISGPGHVATLTAQNNLGLVLCEQKRFDEALPLLQEVLAGLESSLPAGHWMIGAARTYVGDCLTDLARYDEAEALLRSAWDQLNASVGPDHPRSKTAAKALARLCTALGKHEEAAEWARRAEAGQPPASKP